MTAVDKPESIHGHPTYHTDPPVYCKADGDMTTFVDDSANYYGHEDPQIVKEVTQRNYNHIEDYMHSSRLKINGDKSHLVVMTKGDSVAGGVAATDRRAVLTLEAGGKEIRGSDQETLLGAIIHKSGSWKMFIRGANKATCNKDRSPENYGKK